VSGVGEDGVEPRRLVISASSKVVVEAPNGPGCFAAEDQMLIVRGLDAAFKSVRARP
jgi:hypothetical protein